LRTNQAAYCQLLQANGIDAQPVTVSETAVQLAEPVAVERLPHFQDGWVSVQDAAAQFAAPLLNLQPQQRVLDMCAAPGGKTAALLENQPTIDLVAIDIDPQRLKRVHENLHRLQLSATVIAADICQPEQWWDGRLFDRILLDAPCSALGVIRRHPDIKLLRRAEDIAALQQLQAQMLDVAWTMLASGGLLLYATCSILKAENAQQISTFLANHPDSVELPIVADWGQAQLAGRQIITGELAMDGFYYARLAKH
jgi:16S rRNA (cytosine967-C5)-methyltransferase